MRFYKVEAYWETESPFDYDSRRVFREYQNNLARVTEKFNRKMGKAACIFACDMDDTYVELGVLADSAKEDEIIYKFIKEAKLNLRDICVDEITFETFSNMLHKADANFIPSEDVIFDKFGLGFASSRGYGRHFYGENLIEDFEKAEVYDAASKYLMQDSLTPEFDRIYSASSTRNFGHPVHYMLETDDRDTRREVYKLLLEALYANKRLRNRRYSFIDVNPGEDLPNSLGALYNINQGGAMVIRYSANDDVDSEHAMVGMETIEAICEYIKAYRNTVLTIICLPRECSRTKALFYEYLGSISIIEFLEDFATMDRARDFLKMLAKENKIRPDKMLLNALDPAQGYLAPDLHRVFDEWYNNKLKTVIYPQYKDITTAQVISVKKDNKGSAYDELSSLIGLKDAKEVINAALDYYKMQKIFKNRGLKQDKPAMHMVFTGNPGTAKTTVARLFAKIMQENGLLSKGHLVEVGRSDLVGKYVGWTAPTVKKKFEQAKGGVLFIDEAYSLVDKSGSFGDEAITTIVQEMENHRDELIVIFAGYPDKMQEFLDANPGLTSRIAFHVPFSDYDSKELCQIAGLVGKAKGVTLSDSAKGKLLEVFEIAKSSKDFGNGRYVRNVIEKAKMKQASRILSLDLDKVSDKELVTIEAEDIDYPLEKHETKRKIGFCA